MDVSDKNVPFFKQSWVNSSNPYTILQILPILLGPILWNYGGEVYSSFTAIHVAFFIKNHISLLSPFHLLILMGWGDVKTSHPLVDPLSLIFPPNLIPILPNSYPQLRAQPKPSILWHLPGHTQRDTVQCRGWQHGFAIRQTQAWFSGFYLHWPWILGHVIQLLHTMMLSLPVPPVCNTPNSQCCFATKLITCKMPIT